MIYRNKGRAPSNGKVGNRMALIPYCSQNVAPTRWKQVINFFAVFFWRCALMRCFCSRRTRFPLTHKNSVSISINWKMPSKFHQTHSMAFLSQVHAPTIYFLIRETQFSSQVTTRLIQSFSGFWSSRRNTLEFMSIHDAYLVSLWWPFRVCDCQIPSSADLETDPSSFISQISWKAFALLPLFQ